MSTHFDIGDPVILNSGDPETDGIRGVVSAAEHFNSRVPITHERWAKVEMLWPGSSVVRSYSFKESDLLPDHVAAAQAQGQPDTCSV